MADFIVLECPQCGAGLEITDDLEHFACAHCHARLLVNRGGGVVSLKPMVDELKGVKVGVDKTASELAIVRLRGELAALTAELKAIDEAKQQLDEAFMAPDTVKIHDLYAAVERLLRSEGAHWGWLLGYNRAQVSARFASLSESDLDRVIADLEQVCSKYPRRSGDDARECLAKVRRLKERPVVLWGIEDRKKKLERHRQVVDQ